MFRRPAKRPGRRRSSDPIDRQASAESAAQLFNRGEYWEAHEALERIWRSVADEDEARVWQGLIQAAAALLHQARGNRHGVSAVGEAALEKLQGPQHPGVEFDTEELRRDLERALKQGGPAPVLNMRDQ